MIKSLHIKNYALIQSLEMTPSDRLNIITGETGAGKSIMLGAVGLLLGNRADTKALLDNGEKCVVEGVFDIADYHLKPLFDAYELEYEEECIIRREISPSGKSRAFINDTPTNLTLLKELGVKLMDVHSQHESLQLGNNQYQLEILDTFAGHSELLDHFQSIFKIYQQASKHLLDLEKRAKEGQADQDYKSFLLEELSSIPLNELDQEQLEEELKLLENTEEIKTKLAHVNHILDESEVAVLMQLKEATSQLNSLASFSKEIVTLAERVESTSIELHDVLREVQNIQDQTLYDAEKVSEIKDKLDTLYRLQKKHNVLEVKDLIEIRDSLDEELQLIGNLDAEIEKAQKKVKDAEQNMQKIGAQLNESRKLYAINFADEIEKLIHKLGMENATVEVRITSGTPTNDGLDNVDFLFSANKGIPPQELKEVASGGEFSRLIFAIKYLIADKTALPTIIFDEIDTGVSGQVALQMVDMMKKMAQNHQVISISHLPQFAAGGDAHYFVYKDHSSDRSVSKIRQLGAEDRVMEIAKMIGGAEPGDSAIQSARELLNA
jgi:DNA repair protein RecN (Recombination protein N)